MRIISGNAKGRSIFLPGGNDARPTSDFVKEALFNILSPMEGKTFLDIFAGSGNIGIEALSRGASFAVFIENDPKLSRVIRKNLLQCGICERNRIMTLDMDKAVRKLHTEGARFDIIFTDPPYEKGFVGETLSCLNDRELLADDGYLIIQHSVREKFSPGQPGNLNLSDQRRYGDTLLSFLKYREGKESRL